MGFLTSLLVVARDAKEAQNLALEMEGERWSQPLLINECEVLGDCQEQEVGVFDVGPYNLFSCDAEDEDEER
jgi:hypothetical protein